MFQKPIQYVRPKTITDALDALQTPNSVALSGGALAFSGSIISYDVFIDLQNIDNLKAIEADSDIIRIGAGARLQDIVDSALVPQRLKIAITRVLTPNLRNNASVGETLLAPELPAEWLTSLTALDTLVHIARGQEVTEHTVLESLKDPGLLKDGIVIGLSFTKLGENDRMGLAHVARSPADAPIVSAAATLRQTGGAKRAIVAIFGASQAPHIIRISVDIEANELDIDTLIGDHADPVSDYKGAAEYRLEMAKLCVRRALADAQAADLI